MQVVLLAGWSNAGKDTLGNYLVANHGFKRYAFADAVKDAAAKRYGFDRALADTHAGKETMVEPKNFLMPAGRTVRQWVTYHAEERKRVEGADCWAASLATTLLSRSIPPSKVVVTDWRFPEELVALQRLLPADTAFFPVRVVRPGQRVSPVASMTEYALSGFPMPQFEATASPAPLLQYLGLPGGA
jgi:hypothetical protein